MAKGTKGWIVSMWIDKNQTKPNRREDFPHLSWSPYDRVTIAEIDKFSQFFEPEDTVSWNGTVQHLHLIPMQEGFDWKPGDSCLIRTPDREDGCYGMYCIVTVRLREPLQNIGHVKGSICAKMTRILQEKNISWQGFHSLGAEDFVGIFLADTIKDLAVAVEVLRQMTVTNDLGEGELFGSICSFIGLNDPVFSGKPEADLVVRLNVKSGRVKGKAYAELVDRLEEKFKGAYKDIVIREFMVGKGCFEVEIPNHKAIFECFFNSDDGIFNGNSHFYNAYIASSRTYWSVEMEMGSCYAVNIGNVDIDEDIAGGIIDMKRSENSAISPVSRFILREYERMLNSNNCLWWRSILKRQYEAYGDFVKDYTEQGDHEALCSLNNKMQTVLFHINQATAPIYEIPYHNYYYSGSYNDILRMYYGIIAAIFNLGCELPRSEGTKRHKIVFSVDFEAATKVHSTIYKLSNRSADDTRFVVFHLPYDAFMEFNKTVKLLFHEVFHYIAPYERKKRNIAFVKTWTTEVFGVYQGILAEHGLSEQNWGRLVKYFYGNFHEIFEKIQKEIPLQLYDMILNDFTEERKLGRFERLLHTICRVICEEVLANIGFIQKDVKIPCTYQKICPMVFQSGGKTYLLDSIRRVALAAKEAFCDLNMLYALDMSLEQYLLLIQSIMFGQYRDERILKGLSGLLADEQIGMGSFELRIGMVFDQYLCQKAGDSWSRKYSRDILKKELEKIDYSGRSLLEELSQYLLKSYDQYTLVYEKKREIFSEFFSLEKKWFEGFGKDGGMIGRLRKAAALDGKISENLSVIHDFMGTEINDGLLDTNMEQAEHVGYYSLNNKWIRGQTIVSSLGEYVGEVYKIVHNWKGGDYWYRGLCSEEHNLLPSLFRKLDSKMSLYANQARFLKAAYYITLSDPTLWNEQAKGTAEHTCLLQHYGMPTSLLDFSNDMLVALHFALNPDVPADQRKVDEYVYQPRVVLFNPLIYNEAILSLSKGEHVENPENISPVLFGVNNDSTSEYFVDNMSSEYLLETSRDLEGYVPDPRINKYPSPMVIRRNNARILAQSGTFLAYNLTAKPQNGSDKPYNYLALESVQEEYLKLLRKNGKQTENGMFIYEIYIDKFAVPNIKKQLRAMKISTARMYPELYRGFGEYMENLKIEE